MADEKLSQLPTGTAIVDADLSYWDQSASSVSQPASAISTYANSKLPVGSAAQKGIVEVDGTTITASSGVITAVQPTGANPTGTAGPAAVNGTATTFMRSDGAPAVQKASASVFGIVEVDNTTITAAAGVITAVQPTGANPTGTAGPVAVNGSATTFMRSDGAPAVQKASATQFGIVEVDGTSITAVGGVISSTGGGGTPGGSNTDVQFNNSGAFGGDGGFTYAGSGQATLALGTITANAKALNITGTWNNAAVTFDAPIFASITDTASGNNSLLIDLQVGGGSVFQVDKRGDLQLGGSSAGILCNFISMPNGKNLSFGGQGVLDRGFDGDVGLWAGAGLHLYSGSNYVDIVGTTATDAQAFLVYNTSDVSPGSSYIPTNYERGVFDWTTTANTLTIGTQAGGTGTLRGVSIVGNSLKMGSSGMFTANGAVATLLGSVGPTGASTTVTKWLTIIDNGGTTRYIPCF